MLNNHIWYYVKKRGLEFYFEIHDRCGFIEVKRIFIPWDELPERG